MQLLGRKSTRFSALNQYKAALMCLLILIAGAPNLHAQAPPAPYETNCQSNGHGGWIVTVDDSDASSTISYTVYSGGVYCQSGEVYPGGQFNTNCGGSLTGDMYAYDSLKSPPKSQDGYLSF